MIVLCLCWSRSSRNDCNCSMDRCLTCKNRFPKRPVPTADQSEWCCVRFHTVSLFELCYVFTELVEPVVHQARREGCKPPQT